ncbi:hypothetical protein HL658_16690 [Azospirillum sp. RWY-5-1]|uniref:Uncharacterized protein n=2 Tax=Azospirillum oleiclasticum TaxID=2735135 RepID=A0ABX2TF80_9PROT|nr:hypothetical protein [Azospirillum oleiclasticum]NYZ14195.1 hypothetical protein [Azospirillum oleiclasticum]NYZ21679.1 hypothetical protein [Azospirillum oleiclasticum]
MNHITPTVDLDLAPEEIARAERMADAYAEAFPRLVPGSRVIGQRWEAWPNDAVFRVVTIAVPAALREDAARLVAINRDVRRHVYANGVAYSPYVVHQFETVGDGA